jgi:hypothetical protein
MAFLPPSFSAENLRADGGAREDLLSGDRRDASLETL